MSAMQTVIDGVQMSAMQSVDDLHPADGVVCKQCGTAFRVTKLDTDGDYLISDDEFECVPNYCPVCGRRLVESA